MSKAQKLTKEELAFIEQRRIRTEKLKAFTEALDGLCEKYNGGIAVDPNSPINDIKLIPFIN